MIFKGSDFLGMKVWVRLLGKVSNINKGREKFRMGSGGGRG